MLAFKYILFCSPEAKNAVDQWLWGAGTKPSFLAARGAPSPARSRAKVRLEEWSPPCPALPRFQVRPRLAYIIIYSAHFRADKLQIWAAGRHRHAHFYFLCPQTRFLGELRTPRTGEHKVSITHEIQAGDS